MPHILTSLPSSMREYLDEDCFALLSTDGTADRVAIFVHGFGGHARKTWGTMAESIMEDSAWANCDVFFIGYNSIQDEVMLSAAYVAAFIRSVYPKPPSTLLQSTYSGTITELRSGDQSYKSLELIGHSLGGVILRAAILELHRRSAVEPEFDSCNTSKTNPLQATLRLFAPAQAGARLTGKRGIASRAVGIRQILEIYKGHSPSLQELQPDSPLLRALRDDTNFFADKYPDDPSFRASVVWAHRDETVSSGPYRWDRCFVLLNTTHVSVCKVTSTFLAPFKFATTGELLITDGAL